MELDIAVDQAILVDAFTCRHRVCPTLATTAGKSRRHATERSTTLAPYSFLSYCPRPAALDCNCACTQRRRARLSSAIATTAAHAGRPTPWAACSRRSARCFTVRLYMWISSDTPPSK